MSAKTELQAQALQERLNLRLATATYTAPVSKSYSSGEILLTIDKSATALDDWAMILIAPQSVALSGQTDALGLTQRVYSPHVVKVLFDNDVSDGTKGTAEATKFAVLGEVLRTGMRVELYLIDAFEKAGNKYLEVGDMVAANLTGVFENLDNGLMASV